ncbi:DivIVA domain-containing protein [Pseudactinotalea sp. Z1732]|uniref:DivIVA domain-containing protein n=1 Tax=Micrococcales TaxID=85006 RepID=UPI003C7D5B9C
MALLTADDVLNKKFQPTKFREGYDQDEVDDFLDEVVATLRVVSGENEELKAKLEAAEARIAELSAGTPADETANLGVVAAAHSTEQAPEEPSPAEPSAASPVEPEPEPSQPSAADATPAAGIAAAQTGEPESATGMLQLAQRLHDEYVANGKAEADRILTEARTEGEQIVNEAEEKRTRTLNQLEGERSLLERKIDELRVFERDYRTRLKSYLEGLLSDVEGRGSGLSGYGGGSSENDLRRP